MCICESELHHSIGSPIDGAHPGPKTDRDYLGRYCNHNHLEQSNIRKREVVVGGYRSLVAVHWRLKPEDLGSIPGGTNFLSIPLPFQRSSDRNGPNNLQTWVNPIYVSGYLCCDEAQILSKS